MHSLLQGTFQIAMKIALIFVLYFVVILFTYVFLNYYTFFKSLVGLPLFFSFTFIKWLPWLICACSQRRDELQDNNLNIG